MTVSMLTTRLSWVMTGCGGKLTTCSRRSSSGRIRSTNGTSTVNPGEHTRWNRPRRSTMPAVACGTIRMVRAKVTTTTKATTMTAIRAAVIGATGSADGSCDLQWEHDGCCAVDLCDVHRRAGGDDGVFVVGAGTPDLAADADLAGVRVDDGQSDGAPPHQGGRPGAQRDGGMPVPAGDRPGDAEQQQGGGHERDDLYGGGSTQSGNRCRGDRGDRQHPQDERER